MSEFEDKLLREVFSGASTNPTPESNNVQYSGPDEWTEEEMRMWDASTRVMRGGS